MLLTLPGDTPKRLAVALTPSPSTMASLTFSTRPGEIGGLPNLTPIAFAFNCPARIA